MPDETQRDLVARKARDLFTSHGYGATTTDDIAASCKISKRTLYRLFSSKQDLFAAAVDLHRFAMLKLPGDYDRLPLQLALEEIFRVDIDAEADRERAAFLRLAIGESARFPELRAIIREHGIDASRRLLAAWFAHQRDLCRIAIDDVESAARMLMDMMFGAVVFKADSEVPNLQGDERKAHQRRCIRVFVDGVRPRSGNVSATP
ncbi:MAG: TetR/AcrR family transcriptional regulator [Alphaproteobacteria bacterium]